MFVSLFLIVLSLSLVARYGADVIAALCAKGAPVAPQSLPGFNGAPVAPLYFPLPTVAPLSETEQYRRLLRVIDTLPAERRARVDYRRARRIARTLANADRYGAAHYPPS